MGNEQLTQIDAFTLREEIATGRQSVTDVLEASLQQIGAEGKPVDRDLERPARIRSAGCRLGT